MDGLPGGLGTVVQLHTLSIDLAAHVIGESDGPSSLSKATLPAFAAVRRQASAMSADASREHRPALPAPDTKRRARQAALRRARAAREDTATADPDRVAPIVSIHELSSGSDADLTTQSSGSSCTDGLAGPLRKRGRKTGVPVKRHFVLVGQTLYKYRSKRDTRPKWKLNLSGAQVSTDSYKRRIVISLDGGRHLVLYARTSREVDVWGCALGQAADGASTFFRNNSPTFVQHFDRATEEVPARREPPLEPQFEDDRFADSEMDLDRPVRDEIDVVDMARMVKENGEWDSFRSFSALQVRTTWKRQE